MDDSLRRRQMVRVDPRVDGGRHRAVSFGLLFNGERHGGGAAGDELYYLWVTPYAA
jgi:hypothetical protein